VLIAAAVLVQARTGATGEAVAMSLGESKTVMVSEPVRLRVDEVHEPSRAARLPAMTSTVVSLDSSRGAARAVRLGPWTAGRAAGFRLVQVGMRPALTITAQGPGGGPLSLFSLDSSATGPSLRIRFAADAAEQQVALPAAGVVLRMVASGRGRSLQPEVQALSGEDGRALGSVVVARSAAMVLPTATVSLTLGHDVLVRVERLTGSALATGGTCLWLLGLAATVAWPRRQVWVLMRERAGRAHLTWTADGLPPPWWPAS
jgi:hypothetical protein